jgi:hypothetical protein
MIMQYSGIRGIPGVLSFAVSFLFLSLPQAFGHEGHSDAGVGGRLVTVTGKLRAIRSDDFKNKKSASDFTLEDSSTGKLYSLHFTGGAPTKFTHGANLTIMARDMGGNNLMMGNNDGTGVLNVTISAAATSGDQKTLVLMVGFLDSNVQCTPQQVADLVFTDPNGYSVNGMYQQTSFGAMTLSGETHSNVNISALSTDTCNASAWANAADQAASGQGVNVSSFPRRIYVLPPSSCDSSWAGLGTIGGSPSRAWIAGRYCGYHDVYAHEFGHNVGMHHSNADGGAEYHDISDIMGYGGVGLRQVNGPHKVQMGWLPSAAVTKVGSGTYNIAPLEVNPAQAMGYSVVEIAKADTNDTYFLSYRRPLGLDSILQSGYLNRLNIHTHLGGAIQTQLITTLGDGETFSDASNGITVTVNSHNDNYLTVSVNAVCVANPPSVTVSPSMQGGAAGATLNYAVSIQNRDSPTCPASAFSLSAGLLAGFTGTFAAPALSVAPGQSGNTSIAVTSAVGTGSGTYPFTVSTSDSAQANHVGSGTASYVIDGEAPSAPTGLMGSFRGKKLTLRWSPSSDNVGVVKYTIYRDGSRIADTTTNSFSQNASGTHSYFVTASDAAGNVSAASNTVSAGR